MTTYFPVIVLVMSDRTVVSVSVHYDHDASGSFGRKGELLVVYIDVSEKRVIIND